MSEALKGLECGSCGFKHPEGISVCPRCGSAELKEFDSSGKGEIYTYTVSTFVPAGRHKHRAPYVIAVVETEEGMRLSTIVDDADVEKVKIGDKVVFDKIEEGTGPLFKVA